MQLLRSVDLAFRYHPGCEDYMTSGETRPFDSADVLVVVPCGRRKVWDSFPGHGPAQASDAYTGSPFRLNRQYAEKFGHRWVVLSAKYGFVSPNRIIPGPYDVTFNRPSTGPIEIDTLARQAEDLGLSSETLIVVLGGRRYREIVTGAILDQGIRLVAPFAGLPIGKAMQATKHALTSGDPGFGPAVTA